VERLNLRSLPTGVQGREGLHKAFAARAYTQAIPVIVQQGAAEEIPADGLLEVRTRGSR